MRIAALALFFAASCGAGITQMFPWCVNGTVIVPCVAGSQVSISPAVTGADEGMLTVTTTDTLITSDVVYNVKSVLTRNPASNTGSYNAPIAGEFDVILTGTHSHANTQAYGLEGSATHDGSSTARALYGLSFINYTNAGSGDITGEGVYGMYTAVNPAGGNINLNYGIAVDVPGISSPATITTNYAFWAGDQASSAITNNYYSWFDSRGVRRVKEDSTFDAVGQAIEALYNPQFAKYTPGTPNYERVVLGQWNANVAEIGTEAHGTGTLRSLRLIGNTVIVNPLASATDSLPVCRHTDGTLYNGTNTAGVLACP